VLHDTRVQGCLAALRAQDLDVTSFEVIVVDNGPDEGIRQIAAVHEARYVVETTPGSYAARARGVSVARGRVIAFTDADCVPSRSWVSAIAAEFDRSGTMVVVGPSRAATTSRISGWVQRVDDARWARARSASSPAYCDTRNLAVLRELLRELPIDASFKHAGDIDLGLRIRGAGVPITYVDSIVVTHAHPESLRAVLRRSIRRGRGLVALERKHGESITGVGERSLTIAGRDIKPTLLSSSRRRGVRWLLAAGLAVTVAASGVGLWLLARLPICARHGQRLFTAFERQALLLGRATA
jgi:cellulose synthase/poly-beta-1,6-N-acetylglucosamine synthase-like glycosyltransferase